jgi:hypothetical protein
MASEGVRANGVVLFLTCSSKSAAGLLEQAVINKQHIAKNRIRITASLLSTFSWWQNYHPALHTSTYTQPSTDFIAAFSV